MNDGLNDIIGFVLSLVLICGMAYGIYYAVSLII